MAKTAAQKAAEKEEKAAKIAAAAAKAPDIGDGQVKIRGQHPKAPVVGYEWAANKVKLGRALAHVSTAQPELTAGTDEHDAAVKDRYTELKGRVHASDEPARKGGKKGGVVNLADDDGSDDIENDDE